MSISRPGIAAEARFVGIIRPSPAFAAAVHGILHTPARAARHARAGPRKGRDRGCRPPGCPYIGSRADGATERTRTAARARHERAVLDRLRERRLVDLLRARPPRPRSP